MSTAGREAASRMTAIGESLRTVVEGFGDFGLFAASAIRGLFHRSWSQDTLIPVLYMVGVRSVPVVAVTGMFIGMVLAVQSYSQYHQYGLATQLGGVISLSVIRELGPVLAATMLAGRVGSAMAAELAAMRTNEQIDALATLGVNPLHYLTVPRLLACVLLIPLLTVVADFMGVLGGEVICVAIFHIDPHLYWRHARAVVTGWDLFGSLFKPVFFGAAIALISCQRGFSSRPGAEGVGEAATAAFVRSFIVILVLDFFLVVFLNSLYDTFWPGAQPKLF